MVGEYHAKPIGPEKGACGQWQQAVARPCARQAEEPLKTGYAKYGCGFHVVGAEPPPSRSPEAYDGLKSADYDSSPRPCERTLCVVPQLFLGCRNSR